MNGNFNGEALPAIGSSEVFHGSNDHASAESGISDCRKSKTRAPSFPTVSANTTLIPIVISFPARVLWTGTRNTLLWVPQSLTNRRAMAVS